MALPLANRQPHLVHLVNLSQSARSGLGQVEVGPDDGEDTEAAEDEGCLGAEVAGVGVHDLRDGEGRDDGCDVGPEDAPGDGGFSERGSRKLGGEEEGPVSRLVLLQRLWIGI